METLEEKFIALIEKAISEARIAYDDWQSKGYPTEVPSLTVDFLISLKDDVLNGKLRRPSQGIGFGLGRHMGEWADPYPELMKAVHDVDRFYKEEM